MLIGHRISAALSLNSSQHRRQGVLRRMYALFSFSL